MNALMPGGGGQAPQGLPGAGGGPQGDPSAPPASDPHADLMSQLDSQQGLARALFDKLQKSDKMLLKVRKVLDRLLALVDNVDADDVIDAGGELVAAGLGATNVATLLSQVPQAGGGAAIAGWLNGVEQMVVQREQQVAAELAELRHHLAASALRVLAGHAAGPGAPVQVDAGHPALAGAQKAPDGNSYVPDPRRPGKFMRVEG